ncbi:MAG: hypothetical protein WA979_06765 [Pacificimonas sp.]
MDRKFLIIALGGFALTVCPCAANAQDAEPAPPPIATPAATDSGVIVAAPKKRIPLDQFMVPTGCQDLEEGEICVTGDPYEEPEEEETTPDPGDRLLDVQSERATLANTGAQTPMTCNQVGPGGASACAFDDYRQWKRERELKEKREEIPVE